MSQISIALATYRGEKHLREQLDSLASQTRPPDELVACDDQSDDSTVAILEAFGRRAGFPVRVARNETRLGFVDNFGKAIGLCSGDVIFPCDQDDIWHPTKLERHEAVYDADPEVGLICNDARMVDAELRPMGRTWFETAGVDEWYRRVIESDDALRVVARSSRMCGRMMSFRARFWELVAPIPPRAPHDDWLAMCLAVLSRIRIIAEPLNDYRQHPAQTSGGANFAADRPAAYVPGRAEMLENRAIELIDAMHRLNSFQRAGLDLQFPEFRSYLKGHIGHLWRRSSMPNSLLRRAHLVLIELFLGNYARYNDSVKNSLSYDLRPRFFATPAVR